MHQTVLQALGLVVVIVGVRLALGTSNVLILLGSVSIGAVAGETVDVAAHLQAVARVIESRTRRFSGSGEAATDRFIQGFVTTSLLFCVGPMTIVGALQDGLTGDFSTLAVKSMLDGITSVIFAASLGVGVLWSAVTVLVVQGTLRAAWRSFGRR